MNTAEMIIKVFLLNILSDKIYWLREQWMLDFQL